jgi:MFS family permease
MSGVLLATLALVVRHRVLGIFGLGAEGSAGLYMAAMMAARAGAALGSGSYLDRVTSRTSLLLPAMLMVAAGFVLIGLAQQVSLLLFGLLLVGAGSGSLTIPLLTLLGDVAPRHLHGRALSIYQWTSDLGGAAGPAAGLEFGAWFGYEITYAAVGLAMLAMVLPLKFLIARDR